MSYKLKQHSKVENGRKWPKALCGCDQVPMTTEYFNRVTCAACIKKGKKLVADGTHRIRKAGSYYTKLVPV